MTAVVWIIGILKEEYGLDIKTVDGVSAKEPRVPIEMPDGCQISLIPEDTNLSDMLEKGEIDAKEKMPIHRAAPSYEDQADSSELLETGIKVIDLICPF